MIWEVLFDDEFLEEFQSFPAEAREAIAAKSLLIRQFGPHLPRPHSDTLKGSRYSNMKELRLGLLNQAWRVAYAFDPQRRAILLVAGNKQGADEKLFYRELIRRADARFAKYEAQNR